MIELHQRSDSFWISDAGDEEEIEFVRLELDKLYRQFIYM